jgi:pimeloyl-ACP methyl ester carboxylesterase
MLRELVSNNAKPSLILLHGNSLSAKIFYSLNDTLLSNCFSLYTLEIPGHGDAKPCENYTLGYIVNYITELINSIEGEKHILAHSFAGHLVYQAIPLLNNIGSVTTIASPPLVQIEDAQKAFTVSPGLLMQNEVLTNEQLGFLPQNMTLYHVELVKDLISNADPNFRASFSLPQTFVGFENESENICSAHFPVNLLFCEHDAFIQKDYFRVIHKYMGKPYTKLIFLPFGLHIPFLDYPDQFATKYIELLE